MIKNTQDHRLKIKSCDSDYRYLDVLHKKVRFALKAIRDMYDKTLDEFDNADCKQDMIKP